MEKAHVTSRQSPSRAKPQGGWQGAKHQANVARVVRLLQAHEERPIRLSELCRNAGISERTLRSIFKEVFGMGPNRYLHVRRLHLVRAALSIASANTESVSAIALRFGFSDGGRMASDYHTLFGEYPSQTLMRGCHLEQCLAMRKCFHGPQGLCREHPEMLTILTGESAKVPDTKA
ncbi:transcriptional regulator EutR [Pseudomonas ogarae]|uniref:helix-turn-helix transcriptional regulator n=1 Tax=Pseudomonas ogarae (strain DSM 112162 / CECT 30235 / F113) TaxID=1114970 RepID=UPI0015613D8E|nr:helix-turn-helix transcriptional regulator [Pseudomonas ogarae]PBJ09162.1 transcriptional regulator EutR [Pseudomonas ogarae]